MIAYQMYQIIPNHLGMTAIERYAMRTHAYQAFLCKTLKKKKVFKSVK